MVLMLACLIAAATVGYAAHRGGTCGVMAMRLWLEKRDARLIVGFAVATGAATLLCLPLAWMLGRGSSLPGSVPIGPALLVGGVLLGAGAVVNGACLVGSLWRLGNGEVHLLALPIGIWAGHMIGQHQGWAVMPPPSRFAMPDAAGAALVAGGGLLMLLATGWLRRHSQDSRRLAGVMAAMGAAGGLLYVALPGWTWVDVVVGVDVIVGVDVVVGAGAPDHPGTRTALATLAGALASGWLAGKLHLAWHGWVAAARSMAGGTLMMLGAGLIPGGNDALLLGSVPAGAASGLAGFAVMNLTILLLAAARISHAVRPAGP
jgi:uncharacterized membrane protein YedE/YeeE